MKSSFYQDPTSSMSRQLSQFQLHRGLSPVINEPISFFYLRNEKQSLNNIIFDNIAQRDNYKIPNSRISLYFRTPLADDGYQLVNLKMAVNELMDVMQSLTEDDFVQRTNIDRTIRIGKFSNYAYDQYNDICDNLEAISHKIEEIMDPTRIFLEVQEYFHNSKHLRLGNTPKCLGISSSKPLRTSQFGGGNQSLNETQKIKAQIQDNLNVSELYLQSQSDTKLSRSKTQVHYQQQSPSNSLINQPLFKNLQKPKENATIEQQQLFYESNKQKYDRYYQNNLMDYKHSKLDQACVRAEEFRVLKYLNQQMLDQIELVIILHELQNAVDGLQESYTRFQENYNGREPLNWVRQLLTRLQDLNIDNTGVKHIGGMIQAEEIEYKEQQQAVDYGTKGLIKQLVKIVKDLLAFVEKTKFTMEGILADCNLETCQKQEQMQYAAQACKAQLSKPINMKK